MWFYWSRIKARFDKIDADLRFIRFMVNPPKSVGMVSVGEIGMAIRFAVQLPAPPAVQSDWDEVDHGVLTVEIEGVALPLTFTINKDLQEEEPRYFLDDAFVGPQGVLVTMSYHYVDDAGNPGPVTTNTQQLLDTVPPVAPAGIGLVETEETPN